VNREWTETAKPPIQCNRQSTPLEPKTQFSRR
jgi:hypothetical protein